MPYVTTGDGCRLHYAEAGAGPPLVLLHGWSQSGAFFEQQLAGLSARHRVLALDFRGHGASERPDHGYRIARLAKDTQEFLGALELERADVLAWSMGCSVVWSYWDLFGPGRISRLVLVDGNPCLLERDGWELGFLSPEALGEQDDQLRGDRASWTKGFLESLLVRADDSTKAWMLAENLKLPAAHAADLLLDLCTGDWRDVIPRLSVPTLVIGGERSPLGRGVMQWIAARVPDASPVMFETGHFMFYEEPARFNSLVADFLRAG